MIVPWRGWLRPLIERSVVDLPAPFAPISVTISPVDLERHAFERVDGAVVGVDVVELKERRPAGAHAVAPLPR